MGGYHPTFMPEESLEFCDSVVIGEAEPLWQKVIVDLENNELKKIYKSSENFEVENVFFDESIFEGKKYASVIPVQFSRGCKFNCEFCSISSFYNKKIKFRCIKNVVEEIKRKNSKYFFITDDNIFTNKIKLKEFLKELIPLKIKWGCQISIDISNDEGLLDLMAKSGCISILIGFESLNQINLKQMNKDTNIKNFDYNSKIKKIKERGIMIYGTFVFGYDGDTVESFEETLNFAIENKFFLANFNPLIPMPGTQIYNRLNLEKRLIYDKWWLDDNFKYGETVFLPKGMTPKQLEEGCFDLRTRFNSYSSIFKRIWDFRSNAKNIHNFFVYFGANLISRREIFNKQGKKLGGENIENNSNKT
jgi:radical SAM superfamily enzyme YgiQ (UPF0313 family)